MQGNLGHHAASFTLDVYGHVTEEMKQASVARMDTYTHVTGDMQKRASEVVGDFLTELLGKELKPWQSAENGAAAAST